MANSETILNIAINKTIGTNKIRFPKATKSPAPEAIHPINIIKIYHNRYGKIK